jgi:hypothetical protein
MNYFALEGYFRHHKLLLSFEFSRHPCHALSDGACKGRGGSIRRLIRLRRNEAQNPVRHVSTFSLQRQLPNPL